MMRPALICSLLLAAALPAIAKDKKPAEKPKPTATPSVTPVPDAATEQQQKQLAELLVDGARHLESGTIDSARLKFQKALEIDSRNVVALANLGSVEYRARDLVKAEEYLRQATRISPGNVSAWLTLGVVAHDANKLDLAIAALAQAVLLDPSNSTAHTYFGVTMGRKGWLDAAESELLRALSLDNTSRDAHFNFAVISLQKVPPNVAIARRHYQRALELGAKRDEVIEKHLGQNDKSVK